MSKPKAIIVDIDGTLADCSHRVHHLQRTPKDWEAFYAGCGDDTPIAHIVSLIVSWCYSHLYANELRHVVILTGRPERTRGATEKWLWQHVRGFDKLLMRPDGDHRADDVLKREIYERDIAPYYDVLFVLEDRSRVVRMWRSIGVPCLQVAEGDF